MDTKAAAPGTEFDFEKFRLRTFVDRLIDEGAPASEASRLPWPCIASPGICVRMGL